MSSMALDPLSVVKRVPVDEAGSAGEVRPLDPARHGDATVEFEAYLRGRVVGQEAAIQAVTEPAKPVRYLRAGK